MNLITGIRHIQLQMEHITEVWKQVDQLQKMLVQREAEIYRMHSQPQPKTTESSSFGTSVVHDMQ